MATSFRFSHLPTPSLNISGPTNPNDVKTIRTYTAISAIFGLGNILFPVFKTHNIPPVQDIPFILLPPLYCALLPLFPRFSTIAYSGCWIALVVAPGASVSDMIFSNWLFHFLIGRFLPASRATVVYLINGATYAATLFLAYTGIEWPELTMLIIYVLSGILFIPAGAITRETEQFWKHRAHTTEQRLIDIRDDIATEMHDLVAYSMSQTVLRARLAANNSTYPENAREEFAALTQNGADTLHELRLLLYALKRQPENHSSPNTEALSKLSHDIETSIHLVVQDLKDAGFKVTYFISDDVDLTRAQTLILSRVAREMGANIIRHGDVSVPVSLLLDRNQKRLQLLSTNAVRKKHAAPFPSSGSGLLSMRERLAALGGTLKVSNEDETWITSATIPTVTIKEQSK